jgi:putative oxidoreductase
MTTTTVRTENAEAYSRVEPQLASRTSINTALLVVRVIVGIIFMMHGAQKVFGAFEGPGLQQMMTQMGPVLGFLVSIGEFFGGLGLVVGFLSRFSAAALIVIMLGAIAMMHGAKGFFLQNQGFEYNLALIGLLAPILLMGPGDWSAGRFLPFMPGVKQNGKPIPPVE